MGYPGDNNQISSLPKAVIFYHGLFQLTSEANCLAADDDVCVIFVIAPPSNYLTHACIDLQFSCRQLLVIE